MSSRFNLKLVTVFSILTGFCLVSFQNCTKDPFKAIDTVDRSHTQPQYFSRNTYFTNADTLTVIDDNLDPSTVVFAENSADNSSDQESSADPTVAQVQAPEEPMVQFNFVAGNQEKCEQGIQARALQFPNVGIKGQCTIDGGCGDCKLGSGCPTLNPGLWGACIQSTATMTQLLAIDAASH